MSRIQARFAELKTRGEAALIPFVTAGDPNLAVTLKILQALEKCKGKIYGPGGAAAILGLRPTTLYGKMRKHQISKASSPK